MLGFAPLAALPLGGLPGGDGQIFGVLYVDPDTFGTTSIGRGPVSITGTIYTDADSFGSHTVVATYTITGALYSDGDSFGAATISVGPSPLLESFTPTRCPCACRMRAAAP